MPSSLNSAGTKRMSFRLPKLYAITDVELSGLSHADQVRAFCAGGARLIQLRDKNLPSDELYDVAKEALAIARRFDAKLLVNDRVDVALALGADGVHLGQDDLPAEAARRMLRPDSIIGLSTHDVNQALKATELPIDYLAIGPVFLTTTKMKPDPVVGLSGLTEVRRVIGGIPLVAIGGITLENAADAFASGADSVAVMSALIAQRGMIESKTRSFLASI
jgi:thiamine-phosphate pyrophosphorylase